MSPCARKYCLDNAPDDFRRCKKHRIKCRRKEEWKHHLVNFVIGLIVFVFLICLINTLKAYTCGPIPCRKKPSCLPSCLTCSGPPNCGCSGGDSFIWGALGLALFISFMWSS